MLIQSITLIRFKRFNLNNIVNFTMNITQIISLILGSNGSGKSSLIAMLTPLPPSNDDFYKDGSKTIRIVNNNNFYILNSTFNPVRHSFIKNDEELNSGGTVTVFKELVKQEFNLTNDIQELLVGNEVFHSMSPARRREWFTKLSDINYDYALSVYNKLKEKNRDFSGALKITKHRLTTESNKLISKEEETKLKDEVELIHSELKTLMERSAPLNNSVNYYGDIKQTKIRDLEHLSNTLLRLKWIVPVGTYPYGNNPIPINAEYSRNGFTSINEVDDVIQSLILYITSNEALLNNAVNEYNKILEKINILVNTGENGIEELYIKINQLTNTKNEVLGNKKLNIINLVNNNVLDIISAFNSIYDIIINIALVIPENRDAIFSRSKLNSLSEDLVKYKNAKILLINEFNKLDSNRVHLESHKKNEKTICPKCSYGWIPGYSDDNLKKVVDALCLKEKEIIDINKLIETTETNIEANKEYGALYTDYIRCTTNWPILNPLWDYLNENNYIRNSPRIIVSILDSIRIDLEFDRTASKITLQINELLDLVTSAKQIRNTNLTELKTKLNEYTIFIDSKTADINKLSNSLIEHKQYKKQISYAFELSNTIKTLMVDLDKINIDMIEMMRREAVNNCIKQLQSALALKETTLNTINMQKGIIKDLEVQINKLTIEEEASRVLVDKLSPTTGIIADGMLGFIKMYVKQMNNIVKKIWTYKMEIVDCGLEDGGLNFKFPVKLDNDTDELPDVKYGSSGMKEIINLAFKLTAMKYLNISNYPLILDEFSNTFDETHKVAAMTTIRNLIDTKSYPQLFIVSHDYKQYGSLSNCEICILDDRNITTPKEYNTNITIT